MRRKTIMICCTLSFALLVITGVYFLLSNFSPFVVNGFDFVWQYYDKKAISNGEKYSKELYEIAEKLIEEADNVNFDFRSVDYMEREKFYKEIEGKIQNKGKSEKAIFKKLKCKVNQIDTSGIVEINFREYHSFGYDYIIYTNDNIVRHEDGEQIYMGGSIYHYKKLSDNVYLRRCSSREI